MRGPGSIPGTIADTILAPRHLPKDSRCRGSLLGCAISDPKHREASGHDPTASGALFSSPAYALYLSTAEELSHDHPTRRPSEWRSRGDRITSSEVRGSHHTAAVTKSDSRHCSDADGSP